MATGSREQMYQPIPRRLPQETMPTMYDLPSELVCESGLPDEFNCIQADLLSENCQPPNYSSEKILVASDFRKELIQLMKNSEVRIQERSRRLR